MKTDKMKKQRAEQAWNLAQELKASRMFNDLETFNNFDKLGKDTRSMVIFLFGIGDDPVLLFDYEQKCLLSGIFDLADNVVLSSVDGQVRIMVGFMEVLYENTPIAS